MAIYSEKEKKLFFNYNKTYYEENILSNKDCNCYNCQNYKTGNCILLEISITAQYVCPHFVKDEKKIKGRNE